MNLDGINNGTIPAFITAIFVIITFFISKRHEIKFNKKTLIYEKKREYFDSVLLIIKKILIKLDESYSYEKKGFKRFTEKESNEFELEMYSRKLYFNRNDSFIIDFIIFIIKENKILSEDKEDNDYNYGLSYIDITLIDYLFDILFKSFKIQLFRELRNDKISKDIIYLKIIYIYNTIFSNTRINDELYKNYSFIYNSISQLVDNFKTNYDDFLIFVDKIIKINSSAEDLEEYEKEYLENIKKLINLLEINEKQKKKLKNASIENDLIFFSKIKDEPISLLQTDIFSIINKEYEEFLIKIYKSKKQNETTEENYNKHFEVDKSIVYPYFIFGPNRKDTRKCRTFPYPMYINGSEENILSNEYGSTIIIDIPEKEKTMLFMLKKLDLIVYDMILPNRAYMLKELKLKYGILLTQCGYIFVDKYLKDKESVNG